MASWWLKRDLLPLSFMCLWLKTVDKNLGMKDFFLHFPKSYGGGQGKVDPGTLLNKSILLPLGRMQ